MKAFTSFKLSFFGIQTAIVLVSIHQQFNFWVLPAYLGLALVAIPPRLTWSNSIPLAIGIQMSSWIIAGCGLLGGLMGAVLGGLYNQSDRGLFNGLLCGTFLAFCSVTVIWIFCYTIHPHLFTVQSSHLDPIALHQPLDPYPQALLTADDQHLISLLLKVIGLSLLIITGVLLVGPAWLIPGALWSEVISRFP